MATNVHITHIEDTIANIINNIDHGQSAIATDTREWVWADETRSYLYAALAGRRYSFGGSAWEYLDIECDDVKAHGDVYVYEALRCLTDNTTYVGVDSSFVRLVAGGATGVAVSADTVAVNPASGEMGFIVKSAAGVSLACAGDTGYVSLLSSNSADCPLHITGAGGRTGATLPTGTLLAIDDQSNSDIVLAMVGKSQTGTWLKLCWGDFEVPAELTLGYHPYSQTLRMVHSGYNRIDVTYTELKLYGVGDTTCFYAHYPSNRIGIGTTSLGDAQLTISLTGSTSSCLRLNQTATASGAIQFYASDRGAIPYDTNSVASVRVELNGTVYRLALYADA